MVGFIKRGVKNVWRNRVRTGLVVGLLAISTGLSLIMLLSNLAIKQKITTVKSSGANAITVSSGDTFGGIDEGTALKEDSLTKLDSLANVTNVSRVLVKRLELGSLPNAVGGQIPGDTSLTSAIDVSQLQLRNVSGRDLPTPPVMVAGIDGDFGSANQKLNLTSGNKFSNLDANEAYVGKSTADKNNLKIGSTFQAFGQDITVVGIFAGSTSFADNTVYLPLHTMQRLSNMDNQLTTAIITVNSIDNIQSVLAETKKTINDSSVEVTTTDQNITAALKSLEQIQSVSMTGLIIALFTSSVILFLIMVLIVRERRREIGIYKAIGASNLSIIVQYVTEALTMTALAMIIGFGLATLAGGSITRVLVSSSVQSADSQPSQSVGPGSGVRRFGGNNVKSAKQIISNVNTNVDTTTLAQGIGMLVLISVLGSAIPTYLIARVRPAEVLRGE